MRRNSRTEIKLSRRITLIILILGILLLLGILFQSFILENFVRPISLVIWLGLRVLQSIDQTIIWGLLLFFAVMFLLLRLGREPATVESSHPPASNTTLENVRYWRTAIMITHDEITELNVLKRYLGKMLASMYAAKQPGSSNLEIYNALKQRSIPLPDAVYAFLFPPVLPASGLSIKQVLRAIWDAPRKMSRRWTGSDVADYYASIEEVLAYIESNLEIKHDDTESDSSNH